MDDIASVHCRAGGAPLADVATGFNNSSRRVAAGSDCVGAGWIQLKVRPFKFLQLQAPSKLLLRVRLDQHPPTRRRQLQPQPQPRAELETRRAGRSARGNRDPTYVFIRGCSCPLVLTLLLLAGFSRRYCLLGASFHRSRCSCKPCASRRCLGAHRSRRLRRLRNPSPVPVAVSARGTARRHSNSRSRSRLDFDGRCRYANARERGQVWWEEGRPDRPDHQQQRQQQRRQSTQRIEGSYSSTSGLYRD